MIGIERKPAPPAFDRDVREPGVRWLAENPAPKRPPPHWRKVAGDLAVAFDHRCAYTAMELMVPGTVDHFVSIDEDRSRTYEWTNYRYAAHWVNSKKSALRSDQILDPCEIGEGWFEIVLPICALRVTERCPEALRPRAHFMLRRLGLDHGPEVLQTRRRWYELYQKGLPLDELERAAPLIARAVRKEEAHRAGGEEHPQP
jgi:hypothetical protein